MNYYTTLIGYLKWHYGKALITTFAFWKNILVGIFNYFSIKNLLGNFFTPWKRLADNYPKQFSLKTYSYTFLLNTIMRIVGMLLRSIVLIIGLSLCILYIVCLPITLSLWLALPLIIASLVIFGLILIIFS